MVHNAVYTAILYEADQRSITANWGGRGGGGGIENDEGEGGASPDVCHRAPDTLATPLIIELIPASFALLRKNRSAFVISFLYV